MPFPPWLADRRDASAPGTLLLLICGCAACAPWGQDCGLGESGLDLDAPHGAFLYQDDAILDLAIELDPYDKASLPTDWRAERQDVVAWLEVLGEQHEVGLRLKGERSFRPIEEKASIKLDLHQWDDDASLHGVRRLTLNNMVQDPTMLAEHVTYRLFQGLGLAAPRQGYACVSIDGEDRGLYSVVETMDEQFVARAFEDDAGSLYEGGHGADLRPGRAMLFQVQNQGVPSDRTDLDTLVRALERSSPATYLETLERYFDLDALMLSLAASIYVGSVDSYITRANNFLLYYEPSHERWTLIPWGQDQALHDHLDPYAPYDPESLAEHGRLYESCLVSEPCVERLEQALLDVADAAEAMGLVGWAEDECERIADLSRHDPGAEVGFTHTRYRQRAALDYLQERPEILREVLR